MSKMSQEWNGLYPPANRHSLVATSTPAPTTFTTSTATITTTAMKIHVKPFKDGVVHPSDQVPPTDVPTIAVSAPALDTPPSPELVGAEDRRAGAVAGSGTVAGSGAGEMADYDRMVDGPRRILFLGGFDLTSFCGSPDNQNDHRTRCKRNMYRIYGVALGVLQSGNLARSVSFCALHVRTADEIVLTTSLEAFCLFLYGTSVYFVSLFSLYRHYPKLLSAINDYATKFGFLQISSPSLHRSIRIGFVVTLAVNATFAVVSSSLGMLTNLQFIMFPLDQVANGLRTLAFLGTTMTIMLLGFPIHGFFFFYSSHVKILIDEFQEIKHRLTQALIDNDVTTESRVDHFRERHHYLCKTVTALSQLASGYVTMTLAFNMVVVCLSIFGLTSHHVTQEMTISQLFNLFFSLGLLVLFSLRWSLLHTAAHSITAALDTNNWTQLPNTLLCKINMILAYCANSKIGIDVYGMFVIDNTTFMMISGTLLTYGVVVVQFQLGNSVDQAGCFLASNQTSL